MLVRMVDTIDPMQLLECASIRALLMMFLIGNNRLAAAYLGKAYPGQPGLNKEQIVISDDGGNSWNEPHTILFSGSQWGHMLRRVVVPEGSHQIKTSPRRDYSK